MDNGEDPEEDLVPGSTESQQYVNFHPWPYLKELFLYAGSRNNSYRMQCVLCKPKNHEVLAFKNSPSNLRKHIERKHPRQRERYTKLTMTLKRGHENETQGDQAAPKQRKLWETKPVSQKSVDSHVVDFVVQGLHPLSVVEQPAFQGLVKHLQPSTNVMSRGTLKVRIDKATREMKTKLKEAMREVEFIGTTTDCWSARRKGYIGVTAHWMDPTSLSRCSAALACKQLKGSHTFTVLADALTTIHTEFNIRDKVVRTTTDNGSNFLKAFKVYGATPDENNNTEPMREQSDQSGDEEEDMGVEPLEVGPLLDEDDGSSYLLPKHHRCACHLMNLVATVDLKSANDNPGYKKLSRSSFAKCQSLWNKSSRSPAVSEIIEEHCKLQLLRPCETRWNSLFYAVERIVRIIKEQGEAAIAAVCSALKIALFTPVEIEFLCEYVKTMSPVAKAVDVLQGEAKVQMGWLVPTITLLKSKLQSLHATSKHCGSLVVALQAALERRFREMLVDPELIAAAILVPKFRTHWTTDENILKSGLDYIKTHPEEQTSATQSDGHVSEEEEGDFFSSIKRNDQQDSNTKQLESYLLSQTDTMDILKTVPSVCRLSVKLNTPLPASAACERLFSTAGNIFTPRRARLGSKLFENLILMRLNRKFC